MNKYRVTFNDGYSLEILATSESEARYRAASQHAGQQVSSIYYLGVC